MTWISPVTRHGRIRGGGAAVMEVTPVKFLSVFLLISVIGWAIFTFAATVLAWILSRVMGASVQFRVAGCNCARDVTLKFKKGAVESVAIGEIKLSFRKSLVKLGQSMISRDPKLQLLLYDVKVVIRRTQGIKKTSGSQHTRSSSRGKWMVITSVIKYISVNVTELIVKIPKATSEIMELKLDIFKDGASCNLGVRLQLKPCNIFPGKWRTLSPNIDEISAPFHLEELLVICQLGYARETGVTIKHVEGTCGEVLVNLSEDIFSTRKLGKEHSEDGYINKDFDPEYMEKFESVKNPKVEESFPKSSAQKYMLAFPEKIACTASDVIQQKETLAIKWQ